MKEGDDFTNINRQSKETCTIYTVAGQMRNRAVELHAGSIGATVKPKVRTGNTLNARVLTTCLILLIS